MFQANLWCYVWDLEDEGIDAVLDRLHGQVGATGISVATSYHSVDHLRIHAGVSSRVYRADGGIYFQPDADHYAATRIKPIVAGGIKSRNPLARIAEACARRHMNLRSWTVCCHNSALVARHESMAVKNVFGVINPPRLCSANPDVRAYLRALVGDLSSNYPLQAVELEAALFADSAHYHRHQKTGIQFGPPERLLLNLCFCESCRQAASQAGVDVEAAARSAKVRLEKVFEAGRPGAMSIDNLLGEDGPIRRFCNWRLGAMAQLLAELKKSCRTKLVLYDESDRVTGESDLPVLAENVDAVLGFCYSPRIEDVEATIQRLSRAKKPPAVEAGFHAFPPVCPDAPTLVREMTRAAELGVRSVNVYNYGIMPEANLDWVRQAIRSASRAAS